MGHSLHIIFLRLLSPLMSPLMPDPLCALLHVLPHTLAHSWGQSSWTPHINFHLLALYQHSWYSGSLILQPQLRDAIVCPSSLFRPVRPGLLYHTLPLVETAHLPFHLPGPVSSSLIFGFSAAYIAKELSYLSHVIFSQLPPMSLPA